MKYPTEKVPAQYRSIYEDKVGRLAERLSPLLEGVGYIIGDPVFVGTGQDITTIGVVYYHDLSDFVERTLLEEGAVFVLCYVLVNRHGFTWEAMDSKSITLTHRKLEEALVLTPGKIRTDFPVRDVDEGEESDFSEYISRVYEMLLYVTGGMRKRKMGGFLP